MHKFIASFFCLLAAVLPAVASRPFSGEDTRWSFHSAFDNQPRKIMETADKAYFFVHQTLYNATSISGYFTEPSGAIFVLDKKNPDAGMKDLARLAPISGFDMRQAAVDPATGLLVIAYSDGCIDLISPDYKVTYIDRLKKITRPGASKISAVSFDPATHDIWLGSADGFMHIDYKSLAPVKTVGWNEAVADICPVGDKVIAVIGGKVCEANASSNLALRSSFTEIASGTSGNPAKLMPLSASHVAYLSDNGAASLLTLDANGTWKRTNLFSNGNLKKAATAVVINLVEHTATTSADGWFVGAKNNGYFIHRPASDGAAPTISTVTMPSGSTNFSSSFDQSEFWFYAERGQFQKRTLSGTAFSEVELTIRPDAPLTAKDAEFLYSPEIGFIVTNRRPSMRCSWTGSMNAFQVSSYRDGKWTNLSPNYHSPYAADTNPAVQTFINSNLNIYPLADPVGVKLDPLFPNVIHGGSVWHGIASVYVDDPRKTPILSKGEYDTGYSVFGINYLFPAQSWAGFNGTAVLGFDADNNLWINHNLTNSKDASEKTTVHILCWPAEERSKALESGDNTLNSGWKEFRIPNQFSAGFFVDGIALKHPKNKNKILVVSSEHDAKGNSIRIFDHKGTLDDPSDDTFTHIRYLNIENATPCFVAAAYYMLENPFNGDVVVLDKFNTYIISPSDPVVDESIPARLLSIETDGGNKLNYFSHTNGCTAAFDEYGRLWIATENDGVLGFSADYKQLVAHFTPANSPLPSDRTFGVGWNPDTKSLFISTEVGIAEVKVDAPAPESASTHMARVIAPFALPALVEANFGGTVAVANIPAGCAARVLDSDGNVVALLPAPENGLTHWNLLDSNGFAVKSGIYRICDVNTSPAFQPIDVTVIR